MALALPDKTIPDNLNLTEITIKSVAFGIILLVVIAGANAYPGLFDGMTVSASIPAAILSMGILCLFRSSNILENNIAHAGSGVGQY